MAVASRDKPLHRDESVSDDFGGADYLRRFISHAGYIAAQVTDPVDLAAGQQRLTPRSSLLVQPDRIPAGPFSLRQLTGTPGQKVGQAELDRCLPGHVGRVGQQPVDRPQRPHGRLGARLSPVVDDPLRLPIHPL
jgi:hypothetical protein